MAAKKKAKTKRSKAKKVKKAKKAKKALARKKVRRKAAKKKVAAKKRVKAKAKRPKKKTKAKAKRPKKKTKAKAKRPKKKAKAKAKVVRRKPALAPTPPVSMPSPIVSAPPTGDRVGMVTHYFTHLGVAIVQLDNGSLREGDTVHIKGHTSDFRQRIESMELDHVHVNAAYAGQSVGLRVSEHAREHDVVYKVA
jgi:hypothetical protein